MAGAWKRVLLQVAPQRLLRALRAARAAANEPMLAIAVRAAAGRVAVDIGANDGLYAAALLKVATRVVAFEPLPDLAAALQARLPQLRVEACALSDATGEMTIFVPHMEGRAVQTRASLDRDANPGFALRELQVPVRRLDDFGLDDVGLIKIDVEGHEEKALHGARETIARCRPTLIVEIEERHHPGRSELIVADLIAMGYRLFHHQHGRLVEAGPLDFRALQPPDRVKTVHGAADRDYINNFLFVPIEMSSQAH